MLWGANFEIIYLFLFFLEEIWKFGKITFKLYNTYQISYQIINNKNNQLLCLWDIAFMLLKIISYNIIRTDIIYHEYTYHYIGQEAYQKKKNLPNLFLFKFTFLRNHQLKIGHLIRIVITYTWSYQLYSKHCSNVVVIEDTY